MGSFLVNLVCSWEPVRRRFDKVYDEIARERTRAHNLETGLRQVVETLGQMRQEQTQREIAYKNQLLLLQHQLGIFGLRENPDANYSAEDPDGFAALLEMQTYFNRAPAPWSHPSACWSLLGIHNFNQLLTNGYDSFKRTLATNYFTFMVGAGDPQLAFLEKTVAPEVRVACRTAATALGNHGIERNLGDFNYFNLLLWQYARQRDPFGILGKLEEPPEGRPFEIQAEGKRISQDLANSALEYLTLREHMDPAKLRAVVEIGGGYGRNAYVFKKLHPQLRYIMVDIPPALWVAQRYLAKVFPDSRIFRFRNFERFADVRDEFANADFVFLLPHQLPLLPDAAADLFVNISSFQEMNRDQVAQYFDVLDRVVRGHIYLKEWKSFSNPYDREVMDEAAYPIKASWQKIFWRECPVQVEFFEALFQNTVV